MENVPELRSVNGVAETQVIFAVSGPTFAGENGVEPVSYTHLTLPTNREV